MGGGRLSQRLRDARREPTDPNVRRRRKSACRECLRHLVSAIAQVFSVSGYLVDVP